MRFGFAAVCLSLLCLGCESHPYPRSQLDERMFGPAAVRIHPTFTVIRDWTGDGKPDGIEATLEVEDQFDDPTRTTGRVMFELYDYRKDSPQFRGNRIGGPWVAFLNTTAQQQEHWNPALRAYTFQLAYPKISAKQYYVLTVQLDLNGPVSATTPSTRAATHPGRLFDQLIIEPQSGEESGRGHHKASSKTPGR